MAEVETRGGERHLLKFKLVYDWLLYCHLVAAVNVFSGLLTPSYTFSRLLSPPSS